jgi:hypothetical protein
MGFIILIVFFLLAIFFYDSLFQRNFRRYNYYKASLYDAKKNKKKLLVVGCPSSGGVSGKISYLLNLYGCGDILIDIKKNSKCFNHVSTDLKNFLSVQKDNSYVIFVSVVLEYIENIDETLIELERVSGGNLYVVPIDIFWERYFNINLGNYNKLKRKNLVIKWNPKHNETKYKQF